MCGRYALTCDAEELVETFGLADLGFLHRPRYNIAPGQEAPVLAEDRRGRRAGLMLWGLLPARADAAGRPHVNARAESVADKPAFRESFRRRRCLIPASGFYEWRAEGDGKTPFWFHAQGGALLTFAALWDRWSSPGEEARFGFAIVTTNASDDVRDVHERMPVIIDAADRDRWLSRDSAPEEVAEVLRPSSPQTLEGHAVSLRVNRTSEDDPALIEPA